MINTSILALVILVLLGFGFGRLWLRNHLSQAAPTQQLSPHPPAKRNDRRLRDLIELWHSAHGQGLAAGKNTRARLFAMTDKMENHVPGQVRARFDEYRQARIAEGKSIQTVSREHSYLRAVFNELKHLSKLMTVPLVYRESQYTQTAK